jgi:hypothetical protein
MYHPEGDPGTAKGGLVKDIVLIDIDSLIIAKVPC